MNELISVIIPVYNVEKYLPKCIESVLNQSYSNLEILLIDDGSPDACGKLCDDYAAKDPRIKVFHKPNGGLSDARNYGMRHATGEYINFIDSDDWVDEHYIETLYRLLTDNNADLSAITLCSVNENGDEIGRKRSGTQTVFDDCTAIESMFYQDGLPWCAQAKLYKKELFDGIEFPVNVLMEDKATTYKIFAKCQKIVFAELPHYKYLVRQGSIMRSSFSEKRLRSFAVQEELNVFIENRYPQFRSITHAYTAKVSVSMLCMISASNFENAEMCEKLFGYLSTYKKEFFTEKCVNKRFRLVGRVLLTLRKLFRKRVYTNVLYKFVCKKVSRVILTK